MKNKIFYKIVSTVFIMGALLCTASVESRAEDSADISKEAVSDSSVLSLQSENGGLQTMLDVNVMTTAFESPSNQTKKNYQCPYTTIVPLKCKVKGVLNLSVTISKGSARSVELYKDSVCTSKLSGSSEGEGKKYYMRELLAAGTYYLKVTSYENDASFLVCASQYNVQDTVMKEGKWTVASTVTDNSTSASPYHKIVIRKKGYIIVNGNQPQGVKYGVSLRLCNSKRQSVSYDSNTVDSHYNGAYFAVTPGTYYLQSTLLFGMSPYRIKYTFKSAPKVKNATKAKSNMPAFEISKTARKKAISLKKNKKTPLVYYTKDSSMKNHRWYKIKVTKKQKITVYMNTTWTSPHIFDAKGKRVLTHTYDSGCRTVKKVKPGSYYIEAPASFGKTPKKYIGLVRVFYWK